MRLLAGLLMALTFISSTAYAKKPDYEHLTQRYYEYHRRAAELTAHCEIATPQLMRMLAYLHDEYDDVWSHKKALEVYWKQQDEKALKGDNPCEVY